MGIFDSGPLPRGMSNFIRLRDMEGRNHELAMNRLGRREASRVRDHQSGLQQADLAGQLGLQGLRNQGAFGVEDIRGQNMMGVEQMRGLTARDLQDALLGSHERQLGQELGFRREELGARTADAAAGRDLSRELGLAGFENRLDERNLMNDALIELGVMDREGAMERLQTELGGRMSLAELGQEGSMEQLQLAGQQQMQLQQMVELGLMSRAEAEARSAQIQETIRTNAATQNAQTIAGAQLGAARIGAESNMLGQYFSGLQNERQFETARQDRLATERARMEESRQGRMSRKDIAEMNRESVMAGIKAEAEQFNTQMEMARELLPDQRSQAKFDNWQSLHENWLNKFQSLGNSSKYQTNGFPDIEKFSKEHPEPEMPGDIRDFLGQIISAPVTYEESLGIQPRGSSPVAPVDDSVNIGDWLMRGFSRQPLPRRRAGRGPIF